MKIIFKLLVFVLVFSLTGFEWKTARADEVKVGKHKISLKTSKKCYRGIKMEVEIWEKRRQKQRI